MDESQLYQTIGRLYAEIVHAGNIVDSQQKTIADLQNQIAQLNEVIAMDKPEPEADQLSVVEPPQLSNVSVG